MTDTDLVAMLLRRDESALTQLQQQYGRYCGSIARKLLDDEEEVREVLNDVLMQTWQSIPPAKPTHLRLYLAKLTRNASLNRIKQQNTRKRSAVQVQIDELEHCIPDRLAAMEPDNQALKQALNQFLRGLKKEYRQIFVWRYWYGETVEELAQRFGCSESRVTGILFRVRGQLKKYLEMEELL